MKKTLLVMLLASMPFMMNAQQSKSPISKIKSTWKTHKFNVEPGDITPGINEFPEYYL